MRKKMRECRACREFYSWVKGLVHQDQGCCSEKCYVAVGPRAVSPQIQLSPRDTSRKFASKKRKEHKHARQNHRKDFYRSQEWLELRYKVFATYGRTCMCCGRTKGEMHVDHIEPISIRYDLALVFENLQVLCRDCNLGKSNYDNKDFR
jgi:5-methylcytosine-specific restriction endonuclease McrA